MTLTFSCVYPPPEITFDLISRPAVGEKCMPLQQMTSGVLTLFHEGDPVSHLRQ